MRQISWILLCVIIYLSVIIKYGRFSGISMPCFPQWYTSRLCLYRARSVKPDCFSATVKKQSFFFADSGLLKKSKVLCLCGTIIKLNFLQLSEKSRLSSTQDVLGCNHMVHFHEKRTCKHLF
jgi:hypothetical protein